VLFIRTGSVDRQSRSFARRVGADPMAIFNEKAPTIIQVNREGLVRFDKVPDFFNRRHRS